MRWYIPLAAVGPWRAHVAKYLARSRGAADRLRPCSSKMDTVRRAARRAGTSNLAAKASAKADAHCASWSAARACAISGAKVLKSSTSTTNSANERANLRREESGEGASRRVAFDVRVVGRRGASARSADSDGAAEGKTAMGVERRRRLSSRSSRLRASVWSARAAEASSGDKSPNSSVHSFSENPAISERSSK
eukprot:414409-Amphidinium_carterae.1